MGHTPFAAEVRDRGKQIKSTAISSSPQSRHYLLLLDQSGSSRANAETYSYIVRRIAEELPDYKQDEIAVAAFQEQAGIVVPFTHHVEKVEAVLLQLGGQHRTALLDALFLASITGAKRAQELGGTTDIILVTDADDNASRRKAKEVREQLTNSGVRLSALIVTPSTGVLRTETRRYDLDAMSEATGGDTIVLTTPIDLQTGTAPTPAYLQTATTLLIQELRDVHNVCFEADHTPDGQHEIKVKAAKGWRIRYPKKVREMPASAATTHQAAMR